MFRLSKDARMTIARMIMPECFKEVIADIETEYRFFGLAIGVSGIAKVSLSVHERTVFVSVYIRSISMQNESLWVEEAGIGNAVFVSNSIDYRPENTTKINETVIDQIRTAIELSVPETFTNL